jgi:hypothetical protein
MKARKRAIFIGTSGWSYTSWRGPFFPETTVAFAPSILCQPLWHRRTKRSILSDADRSSRSHLGRANS